MQNGTVSEEIQGLLEAGLDSGEIIERGYRPGTVYKVQRRYRRRLAHQETRAQEPSPPGEESRGTSSTLAARAHPHAEADMLATVTLAIARADRFAEEIQVLTARIAALEQENTELMVGYAEETNSLQDRLTVAERIAEERGDALAKLRKEYVEATRAATFHNERGDRFWQANQALETDLAAARHLLEVSLTRLAALEPLTVWVGHPCSICHKPMSGSVDRTLAAMLMKGLAHSSCIQQKHQTGSAWGAAIGLGATLYGLSKLR